MKKIGILGGTFNPIHVGHLILAENAYSQLNLDCVLFMPNGVAYFKNQNEVASSKDRINMVNLSIMNNDHFILDDYETTIPGNSYTSDTLIELDIKYSDADFYYIIGADTLFSIESWKTPQVIFDLSTIVVAKRNNTKVEELNAKINQLKEDYSARIVLLDSSDIDISSTDIRSKIKNNISVKYYLRDEVVKYIKDNKLYK